MFKVVKKTTYKKLLEKLDSDKQLIQMLKRDLDKPKFNDLTFFNLEKNMDASSYTVDELRWIHHQLVLTLSKIRPVLNYSVSQKVE